MFSFHTSLHGVVHCLTEPYCIVLCGECFLQASTLWKHIAAASGPLAAFVAIDYMLLRSLAYDHPTQTGTEIEFCKHLLVHWRLWTLLAQLFINFPETRTPPATQPGDEERKPSKAGNCATLQKDCKLSSARGRVTPAPAFRWIFFFPDAMFTAEKFMT